MSLEALISLIAPPAAASYAVMNGTLTIPEAVGAVASIYGLGMLTGYLILKSPKSPLLKLSRLPGYYFVTGFFAHYTFVYFNPAHRQSILNNYIPKNAVGAEIGVWKGDWTNELLQFSQPKKLYLIDPWKYFDSDDYKLAWYGGKCKDGQKDMNDIHDAVCCRFSEQIKKDKCVILRGLAEHAADKIPDGSLDWVYIDGNHLYEFVKSDIEVYYEKVRKGGIIFGDDYLVQIGWWGNGVVQAVDEFVESGKVDVIHISSQFVLRKK